MQPCRQQDEVGVVQHTAHSVRMVSTLRSLSSAFANLLWSALGACFLSLSPSLSLPLHRKGHFLIGSLREEQMRASSVLWTGHWSIKLMSFSPFSPPPPTLPTRHVFLLHILFLSVAVARGQFVTESTSFSHVVGAIP